MKRPFLLLFCFFTSIANAKVDCIVESPCSWLDPVPGEDISLGYCVNSVSGDENILYIERTDRSGNALQSFPVKVEKVSQDEVYAKSDKAELKVTAYADFFVGTLEILDVKLGFFVSCHQGK